LPSRRSTIRRSIGSEPRLLLAPAQALCYNNEQTSVHPTVFGDMHRIVMVILAVQIVTAACAVAAAAAVLSIAVT
jgi:hypothetical protein